VGEERGDALLATHTPVVTALAHSEKDFEEMGVGGSTFGVFALVGDKKTFGFLAIWNGLVSAIRKS